MEDTSKQSLFNGVLQSFGIGATCISHSDYEAAETYDVRLAPGTKVSALRAHVNELQLALKSSISTLSVLTDEGLLRLELPKKHQAPLNLFDFGSKVPAQNGLSCLLGRTLIGKPVWLDIAEAPHTIIAGTTGSGKSTLIHAILANLLPKSDVHSVVFDPKGIDFLPYENQRNINLIYEYDKAVDMVEGLVDEMNDRYVKIRKGKTEFPYIVLVIDEFADLIAQDYDKRLYRGVRLLAQKSRAARIHIVVATQRPSINVLDGALKANFPTRIACRVANGIDSRVVIDEVGAEKLPAYGNAILKQGGESIRFQVAYTTADEVAEYLAARGLS